MKLQIFFFFFSLSLWANGTVLHVPSHHFIEIVSFWAYLAKKTQQQDEITFNSNEIVPFWGLIGKKNKDHMAADHI